MSNSKKQYSFFKKPISKDNFWNLVFWFGMSAGFILDDIVGTPKLGLISNIIRLSTLLCMSILLNIFNKTCFLKKDIFVNSEGRELKVPKDLPSVFFVIVSTIALTVLAGLLLDKYKGSDLIASFVIFPLLFGIPTLFFIFKNCPISILFNRKVWSVMVKVKGSGNLHSKNNLHQWWNDPSFRNSPGNIYYNRNR
ncbi:MAG: hypothetical protein ACIPMY_06895 [Rickettsia endosymbiont of Pentastiridius leporinus]